jgi:hypothetical protein
MDQACGSKLVQAKQSLSDGLALLMHGLRRKPLPVLEEKGSQVGLLGWNIVQYFLQKNLRKIFDN